VADATAFKKDIPNRKRRLAKSQQVLPDIKDISFVRRFRPEMDDLERESRE
jgi:hypothetical protein